MPLPESPHRQELHVRRIEFRGYRRDDGLFEIDARLHDSKSYDVAIDGIPRRKAGDPMHDMWLRVVVDDDLVVRDIVAVTDASPYPAICPEAVEPMKKIIGERIKAGWSTVVREKLGGARGCTHLMELLMPLATAAYQTLQPVRLARPDPLDRHGRPLKIDSCYAYAAHRELVLQRWPAFHTAPPADDAASASNATIAKKP